MDDDRSDAAGRLAAAGRTHVGHVRSGNEDAHLVRPDAGLLVVADGMGGHAAGEVASALAVEAIEERLTEGGWSGLRDARQAVDEAIEAANGSIHDDARRNPSRRGMGTTATVLLFPDPRRWVAGQVGDSRAYLLRDGELSRLTTDHTVTPGSSTLTRALGTHDSLEVDVLDGEARAGDVYLLCSDGLTDMLAHDDVRETLADALGGTGLPAGGGAGSGGEGSSGAGGGGAGGVEGNGAVDGAAAAGEGPVSGRDLREAVEDAAAALVEAALERGGRDNVTVVVAALA